MTHRSADDTNLGALLLRRFRWFDDQLRRELAAQGWPAITSAQSLVFAYLDADGTATAELARRIGVSRQAAHRSVQELVALGLVRLAPDPDDRRRKRVLPTAGGRRTIAAAGRLYAMLEDRLGTQVGPKSVSDLRTILTADWGQGSRERR